MKGGSSCQCSAVCPLSKWILAGFTSVPLPAVKSTARHDFTCLLCEWHDQVGTLESTTLTQHLCLQGRNRDFLPELLLFPPTLPELSPSKVLLILFFVRVNAPSGSSGERENSINTARAGIQFGLNPQQSNLFHMEKRRRRRKKINWWLRK